MVDRRVSGDDRNLEEAGELARLIGTRLLFPGRREGRRGEGGLHGRARGVGLCGCGVRARRALHAEPVHEGGEAFHVARHDGRPVGTVDHLHHLGPPVLAEPFDGGENPIPLVSRAGVQKVDQGHAAGGCQRKVSSNPVAGQLFQEFIPGP
jgi:hypothetical protein